MKHCKKGIQTSPKKWLHLYISCHEQHITARSAFSWQVLSGAECKILVKSPAAEAAANERNGSEHREYHQ